MDKSILKIEKQLLAERKEIEDAIAGKLLYNTLLSKLKNSNNITNFSTWDSFYENIKGEIKELGSLNKYSKIILHQKIYTEVESSKPEWLNNTNTGKLIKSFNQIHPLGEGRPFFGLVHLNNSLSENELCKLYKENLIYLQSLLQTDLFTQEKRKELVADLYELYENSDLCELLIYNYFKNAYSYRQDIEKTLDMVDELKEQRIILYGSMKTAINEFDISSEQKKRLIKELSILIKKHNYQSTKELVKHYFKVMNDNKKIPSIYDLESNNYKKSFWAMKMKDLKFLEHISDMNKVKLSRMNLSEDYNKLLKKNKLSINEKMKIIFTSRKWIKMFKEMLGLELLKKIQDQLLHKLDEEEVNDEFSEEEIDEEIVEDNGEEKLMDRN